jgi:hypothetical protein
VRVESRVTGLTAEGHAVIAHRIFAGEVLSATCTTVRRLHGHDDASALVRSMR